MKPTVGYIVHYTNISDEVQPAIVVKVYESLVECAAEEDGCSAWASVVDVEGDYWCADHADWTEESTRKLVESERYELSLVVFGETGARVERDVPFSLVEPGSAQARGHWTWPLQEPSAEEVAAAWDHGERLKAARKPPSRSTIEHLCVQLCDTLPWTWLGEHDGQQGELEDIDELLDKARLWGAMDRKHASEQRRLAYEHGWLRAAKEAGHLGGLELRR